MDGEVKSHADFTSRAARNKDDILKEELSNKS